MFEMSNSANGNGTPQQQVPLGEPAQFRMVLVAFLSGGIGILAGFAAYGLYKLIGFFTNLFFFHRIGTSFDTLRNNPLGIWVIAMPVIGGLVVGLMAKYG